MRCVFRRSRPEKIEALRTSGITALALNMTSFYDELSKSESLFAAIRDRITSWEAVVSDHPDVFLKVTSSADLDEAKRSGRVGFIFCFQMASPFGWELGKLETFVEPGREANPARRRPSQLHRRYLLGEIERGSESLWVRGYRGVQPAESDHRPVPRGVFCVYNESGWLTTDREISIDHFIAHLEHVINLAGEDHVGVGTDQV